MSTWLLSIVGITVVGVLVELLLTDSPMSKFVRALYGFFILFIIVQPLPAFFKNLGANPTPTIPINSQLLADINAQTREAMAATASQRLKTAGFDAIVTYFDNKIYVNVANARHTDTPAIISIVTAATGVPASAVEVII